MGKKREKEIIEEEAQRTEFRALFQNILLWTLLRYCQLTSAVSPCITVNASEWDQRHERP